jgi:hypothetical protein
MDMDGGGSAPPARPRPGRVALLVAGVVVVVLAAGLGLGVALGRGKGDNAAAVAGAEATTGSTGQEARGTGAAGGGADGQAGSGGGGTGGGGTSGGTTTKTTSRTTTATSTTTGATTTGASTTTTTEMPLAFADPPSGGAQASCTPSKFGGYDFTVRFQVVALFNRSGTIHYQWGRGRDDVRVDSVGTQTVDGRRYVQFNDSISGSVPSRTDTVVDHLHILDPPSVATTVTVTHSICFG